MLLPRRNKIFIFSGIRNKEERQLISDNLRFLEIVGSTRKRVIAECQKPLSPNEYLTKVSVIGSVR